MKNLFFALKQYYKSAPILITIYIFLTVLPVGVLTGFITNYERLMINSAEIYATGAQPISELIKNASIFLSLSFLSLLLAQMIRPYLSEKIFLKNDLYFQKSINKKFQKIKYEYFEQEKMKDLFDKSGEGAVSQHQLFRAVLSIAQSVLSIGSSLFAMWIISNTLSPIAIGAGLIVFVLDFFRARLSVKIWGQYGVEKRKIMQYKTIYGSFDIKQNQAELRVFNTNDKMTNYIYNGVVQNTKKRAKKEIYIRIFMYSRNFLIFLLEAFVLTYVFIGLKNGALNWPIGNIVVAITGFSLLAGKFIGISSEITEILEKNRKIEYLRQFYKLDEEKEGQIDSLPKNAIVEIKNVCFTYPGTNKEILHNVSFSIKCGEHIAFVGENGSGKSTIVKLILGLYEPTSGEILVNGHKITDYTRDARQKLFGVQYQDFYKYALKVREVVAMGNIDILNKDKEINGVLKRANVYDAIKNKNATLDTTIGKTYDDDSLEFSGGEKQRMSLATTLAYNHNHLILDEPTAALDAKAENLMYEVFMSGIKSKGSLIVSHRLASAKISDRIIVFKEGRVVQDGSHDLLMKNKSGLYHKMFTSQAKLYKEGKEI